MLEENAGIHAGEHRCVAARANLQIAQVEAARENVVGG
jgi:DNA-binding transcriptional regulator YbjK